MSFVCEGRNQNATGFNLGIDTIILSKIGRVEVIGGERAEEVRRAVRLAHPESVAAPALTDRDSAMREAAAWVFTQSAGAGRASTAALAKGLSDPDAVVRGLIARAVRSCTCGASMLPELGEALADPDENVRTATDDAVASAGVRALPLLPLLTNRSGRTIMFTFSGASALALGNIGPEAAAALPGLKALEAAPRVRWAAALAVRKITTKTSGKP